MTRKPLYTIGFLEPYGTPCELMVLNEKWIILKEKKKREKRKVCSSIKSIFVLERITF